MADRDSSLLSHLRSFSLLSPSTSWPVLAFFFACSIGLSFFVIVKVGVPNLVYVLGGLLVFAMLAYISVRDLSIALILWMLSMAGLRSLGMVPMPGLPDFTYDRPLLIWIIVILLLRLVTGRTRLHGPYLADILILLHTIYILVQLELIGSKIHFHNWVMSNFGPFFAFMYGKYVIKDQRELRNILFFFLGISIYFYVESIAQQYNWNFLIWPKAILNPEVGALWHPGRSRGPVMHPPLFGQLIATFMLTHLFLLTLKIRTTYKILITISLLFCTLGLVFTYTRGPWLAAACAVGVLAILRPSYRRVLAVLAIVVVAVGAVGAVKLIDTEFLQERMETVGTVENRLGFMANSTRMIADHPLFGVGYFKFNEYRQLYNQGVNIPFYGYIKKRAGAKVPIHDIFLGRLAEEGFFGCAMLVWFTFAIFKFFLKKWRADPQEKWFNRDTLALFAAMMVCYSIGGMVIDYRYFDLVNVVFFLLAGLIYGYRNEEYARD